MSRIAERKTGRSTETRRDLAERIRHREVSRVLEKLDLSPEEKKAVERLSRSLVGELLSGPIFKIMARADIGKRSLAPSSEVCADRRAEGGREGFQPRDEAKPTL